MDNPIDRKELLRQLSFITDPVERLRQYFKHDLKDVALEDLNALIEDNLVYFQDPSRGFRKNKLSGPVRTRPGNDGTLPLIVFDEAKAYVRIDEVQSFFDWSRRQIRDFVCKCLKKAIQTDPRYLRSVESHMGAWEIKATSEAFEEFVPKRWKLRREVHIWLLTAYFFADGYIWGYFGDKSYQTWMGGIPTPTPRTVRHDHPEHWLFDLLRGANVCKLVSKKLLELGLTHKQKTDLFRDWVIKYGETGLNRCFLAYVLQSGEANLRVHSHHPTAPKVFEARAVVGKDAERCLEWCYNGSTHVLPVYLALFAKNGMADVENIEALYRQNMAKTLSKGRIGAVLSVHQQVGQNFELEDLQLTDVAPQAVNMALQQENYAMTAELVRHFGVDACINPETLEVDLESADTEQEARDLAIQARRTQLEQAASLASTLGQTASLNWTLTFVPQR